VTFVSSQRSVNLDVACLNGLTWAECVGLGVAKLLQPFRYGRWSKDGDIVRKLVEGVEGKVVGMGMGHKDCVDLRKLMNGNSRRADTWEELAKGRIEVRVCKEPFSGKLN
jgi:hypothetical protein